MLGALILKLIYKHKAKSKQDEDLELCCIKKLTYLEFYNETDEWYIIPNISISFNNDIDITFRWLKLYYSSYWSVVTYKEENDYAAFIRHKYNKNESSSL